MATEKRLNCPMRHENGNCLPCGGFCTAVNAPICEALHNAFEHGESEERERFTLASIKENRKFQEEQLEALRAIYKKVTSTPVDAVEVEKAGAERDAAVRAAFRLGQMDMRESAAAALTDVMPKLRLGDRGTMMAAVEIVNNLKTI